MSEEELDRKLKQKKTEELEQIAENLEQKLKKELSVGAWSIQRFQATSKNNSKTHTATPSDQETCKKNYKPS